MNVKLLFISLIVMAASCAAPDKQAELVKLRKELDKISGQIKTLELEIDKAGNAPAIKTTRVSINEVQNSTFAHYIEVQGKIDADQNIAIYPEAMGAIEAIYVKPGQKVNKGQVLAKMNDAAIKEQLKALESGYQFASEVYEKQKSLWEQNIGSEVQYLQAKNNKESLGAQLASLKRQKEMMTITAPIAGTLEDAPLKIGQMASPQFPVFRILSFGGLKVTANISEGYASKIKIGDELLVYLPDLKKDIKAKVTFSSNYINPVNRTFQIEGQLTTSSEGLKANMIAVLKVNDYKNTKAIAIPVNLVQNDLSGNFVMVAHANEKYTVAKKVKVEVGEVYNGVVEITGGLKPGDKLIVVGYSDLEEGTNIVY